MTASIPINVHSAPHVRQSMKIRRNLMQQNQDDNDKSNGDEMTTILSKNNHDVCGILTQTSDVVEEKGAPKFLSSLYTVSPESGPPPVIKISSFDDEEDDNDASSSILHGKYAYPKGEE